MLTTNRYAMAVALAAVFVLAGCGDLGEVEQGLVIGASGGDAITVILDSNPMDQNNPKYDRVPPVTVRLPQDPARMGPYPDAGKLVSVDTDAGQAVVFDAASNQLQTVPFELVEKVDNVFPDDGRVAEAGLPVIDRGAGTVKTYAPRSKQIVTMKLSEEYLGMAEDTWKAGDEVRYYFKDPGQALRLMNVTKTKIS